MSRAHRFPSALLGEAESIVRRRTGLVFHESRRSALLRGLAAGLRRSGCATADEYVGRLSGDIRLLDDLAAEITVGETYFFRDEKQFSAIRERMVPDLVSASASGAALRVWSAGCATGEEAYSLAILMRESGQAAHVVGTDISRTALTRAKRGVYREWSLRGVPEHVVRRYFARMHGRFVLDHAIRDSVEFRYLNLAGTTDAAFSGVAGMDLILCRNVLIYFDAPTVAQVAARLMDALSPGGWLVVGASDPPLQDLVPCELVATEGGHAYRRAVRGARSATRPGRSVSAARPIVSQRAPCSVVPMRSPSPAIHTAAPKRLVRRAQPELPTPSVDTAEPVRDDALSELYRTRRYDEAARVAALQVERDRTNAAAWIVLIRAHANRGDLRAADAACLAGLEHNRLNAELEYLHGVLMIEAGRTAEAAKAFRRAIYLDRTLAVAHLALGQLLSRAGSDDVARRAFRNAEQLLTALPQDAKVRAADGETAGRLLVLTRTGAAIGHGTTT